MEFFGKLKFIVLPVAAFVVLLVGTHWGIGLTPDSASYVGGARNILAGQGYSTLTIEQDFRPITQHAPLYAYLLAAGGITGVDPMQAARWVNAALFGANVFLIQLIVWESTKRTSAWLALLAGLIASISPMLLEVHWMALSEGLFVFFTLSGLWLLARSLEQFRRSLLLVAALCCALACLTRYAGLAVVATGGIVILISNSRTWRSRLVDAALFSVVGLAPLAVWLLRNVTQSGTATSRQLQFHPIGMVQARQALDTLASWLLIPSSASGWMKLIPVIALGSLIAVSVYRNKAGRASPVMIKLLLAFIGLYFGFLVLSVSFVDANTPFDGRILSPVYVALLIFSLVLWAEPLTKLSSNKTIRSLFVVIILAFSAVSITKVAFLVNSAYHLGLGYNQLIWQRSETLALVRDVPATTPIYSNAPDAIILLTGKPAERLPAKFQSTTRQINAGYQADLALLGSMIQSRQGMIVYFTFLQRPNLPSLEELNTELALRQVSQTTDGVILAP